jgi:DNA-binding MarR family transcriptional regulator
MTACHEHKQNTIHAAILALQELSEVFQRRREALARQAGITVEEWRVLDKIEGDDFMPSLFARERSRSRAAVSKIIRQLIDKGIITASVSSEDGRFRNYHLTPRGKAAMERLRLARQKAIADVWGTFNAHELEAFTRFSRELCARLESLEVSQQGKSLEPTTRTMKQAR